MAKNKQYIPQKGQGGGFRSNSSNKNQDEGDDTIVDLVEVKENAEDFFEKNMTSILAVLAIVIAVLGGYLAYKYLYLAPRDQAGMEAIYKAENQFRRDSFALALNNPGSGFEGFLDIIDNYSGTKASNLSKYYAGISYLNLGKYDAAIEYLKEYNASDDITPITKNGAIGDAYAELGEFDNAESYYKKATSLENNFLTPYYLEKLAVLALSQRNSEEAKKYFKNIVDKYPKSNQVENAKKQIIILN